VGFEPGTTSPDGPRIAIFDRLWAVPPSSSTWHFSCLYYLAPGSYLHTGTPGGERVAAIDGPARTRQAHTVDRSTT